MYAPYGTGALVGRARPFEHGDPDLRGGGTVEIVTLDDVDLGRAARPGRSRQPEHRRRGGAGCRYRAALQAVGMDEVARARGRADRLRPASACQSLPGIQLFGDTDPHAPPSDWV